jgi:uncharacterized membrane protein YphA (DoxX/SURF4 family)
MRRAGAVALGLVFLAAGALKCADPVQAALAVDGYDVLLPAPALAVGFLLPGLEVAVGAALVTGVLARGAAALAALLALGFLCFTVSATWRGLDVACGCFGPLSAVVRVGWRTIALDVMLLLVAAGLLRTPR